MKNLDFMWKLATQPMDRYLYLERHEYLAQQMFLYGFGNDPLVYTGMYNIRMQCEWCAREARIVDAINKGEYRHDLFTREQSIHQLMREESNAISSS